jgi:hypothetical protein
VAYSVILSLSLLPCHSEPYLVILSEAKNPCTLAPFRLLQGILSALLFMHHAQLRIPSLDANLECRVSPDPSLFLCHSERSEEPMRGASVEERPFRAASERASCAGL